MDEIDIYRTAKLIADKHGADAVAEANRRAERFQAAGDADGAAVWRRVATAVGELQRMEPDGAAQ